MKVIFLDFDGVLNSEAYVRNCGRSGVVIDPACLLLVKKLVEATGAKIVLTTSWREHWDADSALCDETGREINAIFGREGLEIFDKTQVVSRRREEEIEAWLEAHPEVTDFVALDDRFLDAPVLRGHFVKTSNYRSGMDEKNLQEAIEILIGS